MPGGWGGGGRVGNFNKLLSCHDTEPLNIEMFALIYLDDILVFQIVRKGLDRPSFHTFKA